MRLRDHGAIDGGHSTARVRHAEGNPHADRDTKAYWNVLGFAKEQPDAAEWATDILSALGLDGHTARTPAEPAAPKVKTYRDRRAEAKAARAEYLRKLVADATSHADRGEQP